MTPDSKLLWQFGKTSSEAAFAELVKRHVNLVYSVALRKLNGDEHLAKDVAQTVFTDLARKANSLSSRKHLAGWLYTSAHYAATKVTRGENRRRNREEEFMRESVHETASGKDWEEIRHVLDDAMLELKETDRDAILLRYFEDQPFAEVGKKLGLDENTARMRVERALEKLRAIFTKRGIATATALASAISANAVQLAPANLAATLTTTSIACAGTGTFSVLNIMTVTKLKLALSAIFVAGTATVIVVQQQTQNNLRLKNESLQQQIAQLQADNENLSKRLAEIGDTKKLSDEQLNELLRLRGEVGVLRRQMSEAQEQENAANNKIQTAEEKLATTLSAEAKFKAQEVETVNDMKMLGLAERIYAGDNDNAYATTFEQMTNQLGTNLYEKLRSGNVELVNAGISDSNIMQFPRVIISRESMSHQAPDGMWHRVYGLADGSVQIATSFDGNFDAWEKANTTPSPNPNQ